MQEIVETRTGAVGGVTEGAVTRFLGIPYAAPPAGARRFALPQAHPLWTGVREAAVPSPNAPQRIRAVPGVDVHPLIGHGWTPGDDYLTLNIWKPAGDQARLPVMVFIHGGGFVLGSKDAPVQDGSAFARDGVLLVAINYRMGVEGFLPIPGVPTNLGLRDQLFALRWVQDNIAAFGGDPANVTVFGESAGAMSVANLIASPRAMLDAVEKVGLPTTRIDLRDAEGREPVFGISRFIPVHGDDILPDRSLDALKQGAGPTC